MSILIPCNFSIVSGAHFFPPLWISLGPTVYWKHYKPRARRNKLTKKCRQFLCKGVPKMHAKFQKYWLFFFPPYKNFFLIKVTKTQTEFLTEQACIISEKSHRRCFLECKIRSTGILWFWSFNGLWINRLKPWAYKLLFINVLYLN